MLQDTVQLPLPLHTQVESRLQGLSQVKTMNELVETLKLLGPDIANLLHLAERRQKASLYRSSVTSYNMLL